MTVPGRYIFLACALIFMGAAPALADCYGCDRPQRPPTPPPSCRSCAPPPVMVPPPSAPRPPGVNISAGAEAQANATSIAISHARSGDVTVRTGGGGYAGGGVSASASASAVALAVAEGGSAIETLDRAVLVEAACIDASGARFHAAQTFAAREVGASYSGELFRCWMGTRLQYMSEGGAMTDCGAGEALWYERGALRCGAQTVQGDASAMLRRFGSGAKLVRLTAARAPALQPQVMLDGGVGQGVW